MVRAFWMPGSAGNRGRAGGWGVEWGPLIPAARTPCSPSYRAEDTTLVVLQIMDALSRPRSRPAVLPSFVPSLPTVPIPRGPTLPQPRGILPVFPWRSSCRDLTPPRPADGREDKPGVPSLLGGAPPPSQSPCGWKRGTKDGDGDRNWDGPLTTAASARLVRFCASQLAESAMPASMRPYHRRSHHKLKLAAVPSRRVPARFPASRPV